MISEQTFFFFFLLGFSRFFFLEQGKLGLKCSESCTMFVSNS